jgi:hypothetical protein
MFANQAVIGAGAWTKLSYDPQVLAQVKTLRAYAGDMAANQGRIPLEVLATVFGLEKLLVGSAVKDTSVEGQTSTLSDIWDPTYMLFFYGKVNPKPFDVSLGRTFLWDPYLSQPSPGVEEQTVDALRGFVVDKYPEAKTKSDIVRVEESLEMKLLNKDAGYLLTGC